MPTHESADIGLIRRVFVHMLYYFTYYCLSVYLHYAAASRGLRQNEKEEEERTKGQGPHLRSKSAATPLDRLIFHFLHHPHHRQERDEAFSFLLLGI